MKYTVLEVYEIIYRQTNSGVSPGDVFPFIKIFILNLEKPASIEKLLK